MTFAAAARCAGVDDAVASVREEGDRSRGVYVARASLPKCSHLSGSAPIDIAERVKVTVGAIGGVRGWGYLSREGGHARGGEMVSPCSPRLCHGERFVFVSGRRVLDSVAD